MRASLCFVVIVVTALCLPACDQPQSSTKATSAEAALTPMADKAFVANRRDQIEGGFNAAELSHLREKYLKD